MAGFVEKRKIKIVNTSNNKIDETTDPFKAVELFIKSMDSDEDFKIEVVNCCKNIIKEISTK